MRDGALPIDARKVDQAFQVLLRDQFYPFCQFMDPMFFTRLKPHLGEIASALQSVTNGQVKCLMMSLPPRAGKSYTVSLWCAWMIGRGWLKREETSIMRNSYGQSLAEKFSYDIRAILASPKFQYVFPGIGLKADHARIEDWAVAGSKQSTYFCSGVGGAVTGKGCRTAAILDDPVKNLEDALSELILDKTWSWYLSTHKSRMESGCPEIHIATRWSKKDPIGRLLESAEGEKYEKLVKPALTVNGKSFCDAVKTTQEYLDLRKILDEAIWEAEFMQNPIEAKGLLFPENELKRFALKELTEDRISSVIGYTDTADEGTDFLASLSVALSGKEVFLIDVVFTQEPVEITESLVAQQIIDRAEVKHVVESNSGGKSFARNVKRLIQGKSRCIVSWHPTTTNKETRILMSSGQVKEYFRFRSDYAPGSQYDKFMRQLTAYVKMGRNQHDDAPDAVTGIAEQVFRPGVRFLNSGGEA